MGSFHHRTSVAIRHSSGAVVRGLVCDTEGQEAGREDGFRQERTRLARPEPIEGMYPLSMVGVNSHCVTVDIRWDRGGRVGWGNAGYDGIQLAAIIGND